METREWTQREDAFLHRYRKALNVESIAEALKRTIEDVENRMAITEDKERGHMEITQKRKNKKTYGGRIKGDISRRIGAEAQKRNFENAKKLSGLAMRIEEWESK